MSMSLAPPAPPPGPPPPDHTPPLPLCLPLHGLPALVGVVLRALPNHAGQLRHHGHAHQLQAGRQLVEQRAGQTQHQQQQLNKFKDYVTLYILIPHLERTTDMGKMPTK